MRSAPLAVLPSRDSPLGMGSLVRNAASLAAAALRPQPDPAIDKLARGDGRIVLVVPAFLAGDWATARLRRFLARLGYRAFGAGIALNLGPTPQLLIRLEERLLQLSAGGPVDVIGQSLGGVLARDLAARHPERIRRLVTLCSPIRTPITTPLAPAAALLAPFCDRDWLSSRDRNAAPLEVRVTALYSETDGVVDWRECLQDEGPGRKNVRVSCAHATVGSCPQALAAIAEALTS